VRGRSAAILPNVEILFTTLLVIAAIAIVWFAFYVVYRLYADQR
jgi:flagellar biogenesis protein FliO